MGTSRNWKLSFLLPVIVAISSCSPSAETPAEESAWVVPGAPENSDHGYLLEDNRIPSLTTCEEWDEFWVLGGPAVSFEVAKRNPQVLALAVSTQIFLKNQVLDSDSNGILCDEDNADKSDPVVEENQEASPDNPESNLVETIITDIRSYRSDNLDSVSQSEFDSFGGPSVDKQLLDHYVGSVERAASFWAQFNDGNSLVRSVSVFSHDERDVFVQRRTEVGLLGWGEDWWQRSTETGGGTVAQDADGFSHALFRLHPTGGGLPTDDYAFHEITHSYQDGLGAISASRDFPCWFGEGYAMVVGHANVLESDAGSVSQYQSWRIEMIRILKQYFSEQDESLSDQLSKILLYGHSHPQCNTEEPLFGYRLGQLVSEQWIAEFGFERTVTFMKNVPDYQFEDQFEIEFGISMNDWLQTRALPYLFKVLSEE